MRQTVIVILFLDDISCVLKIKSAFLFWCSCTNQIDFERDCKKQRRKTKERKKQKVNCMLNVDFLPLITNGGKIQ